MPSILEAFKEDEYRLGDLQVRMYTPQTRDQWPIDFLGQLYFKLLGDRYGNRPNGTGILEVLFCGMSDLSYPAIVGYIANRPLVVLGVWEPIEFEEGYGPVLPTDPTHTFREAGFAFPVTLTGEAPDRSGFFGYGIFREFWGNPMMEPLVMLGLAAIFSEFKLEAVHGLRYAQNDLTARYVRRYGFRDNGTIPAYMLRKGKLVSAVSSTLMREDFERYVENALVEGIRDGQPEPASPKPDAQSEPEPEPSPMPLFDGIPRFR